MKVVGIKMNIFNNLQKFRGIVMLIGFCVIMALVATGKSMMVILLVLGALDFIYGLFSFKAPGARTQGICMMLTGIYIVVMGIIFVANIFAEKIFWTVSAGGLIVLAVIGLLVIRRREN